MDFDVITAGMLEVTKGILESGRLVVPMAFIISPNGHWKIMGLVFKDQLSKIVMYQQVSAEAKQQNAVAVFLINDTWVRFEDQPNIKHEALYAQVVMPDASVMKTTTMPYVRKPGGPIEWGPVVTDNHSQSQQNLLPPWGNIPTA
jgi:hypothetical protein